MNSKNMQHNNCNHQLSNQLKNQLSKKSSMQRRIPLMLVMSIAFATTACSAIQPVQAWDKAYLAKNSMKFDHDKLGMKNSEHIYTSKEAAVGASSVGGGGCGCN
jgi:hypothetical protein